MTHRSKLVVLLVGLVVFANCLLSIAEYRGCESLLQKEFHRKARAIVSTAAALLDPGLVATIRHPADQQKPDYARLRVQLQKIRDFNRRKDVWIADIFTLIPASQNPSYVEYGVDAEERFAYEHHAGDIYTQGGQPLTIGITGINRLADNLQSFQAGFNAAFAPIRDASGNLIAMLGVRLIPAPYSTLNEIGSTVIAPFIITLALAAILAVLLGRSVS